jgi:adenylate cyclase
LTIIRSVGATEDGAIDIEFPNSLLFIFTIAPIFGAISGYAQILTVERLYKRTSARKLLIFRLSLSLLFLTILILTSYLIVPPLLNIDISLKDFIFDKGSFPIYFYILSIDIFMAAIWQVNMMLGGSNLWKMLQGKFYEPREENRIFMFLDLKDSTQHAERLGHIKYSRLIQDCFNDLGVVIENEAEIYQYVGDEVILTWKLQNGLRNLNCLNAFYSFKNALLTKQAYYFETYDCLPVFKAGLNSGIVTVTEVGKYKKEIAFHGDTINTAARIQGKCNEFDREFLVSKNLRTKLEDDSVIFELLGKIPLKGKTKEVEIFAIEKGIP